MGRGGAAAVAKPSAPARGGGWAAAMGARKVTQGTEDSEEDNEDEGEEEDDDE